MSKLRISLGVFGAVVIGVGLLYLWAVHAFNRKFDKFISASAVDISELGTAIRGAAGEAFFTQGAFPPKRSDLGKPPDLFSQAKKLLETYRNDPEKFKKNASLFDTSLNAIAVRDAVLKIQPLSKTPANSLQITTMSPHQRLDA